MTPGLHFSSLDISDFVMAISIHNMSITKPGLLWKSPAYPYPYLSLLRGIKKNFFWTCKEVKRMVFRYSYPNNPHLKGFVDILPYKCHLFLHFLYDRPSDTPLLNISECIFQKLEHLHNYNIIATPKKTVTNIIHT